MSTKATSDTLSKLRWYLHLNNASIYGGDKMMWIHGWVHSPRLSAGPNAFVRANVPEVMFGRVTKSIQMEHYSKKSTDTELKSIVGLTAFYCQLASRSLVLAMCLKLMFKLDLKKNLSLEFIISLCIGSAISVKGVILKSFTTWHLGTRMEFLSFSCRSRAILAISLPEKEMSRSRWFLAPHIQTESQLLHVSVGY